MYKSFEYIVNQIDNKDENFNYYILLNEEKNLKNNIDEYNLLKNKYENDYETLVLKNRNLLNLKTILEKDIATVDKLINDIHNIANDTNKELMDRLVLEQYKLLFRSIYTFYLIIDDLYRFMNINNYKIIILKNYINNMIIKDINDINNIKNYINILRKNYINNMLIKDMNDIKNINNYKIIILKNYINNMLIKDMNDIKNMNNIKNYINILRKIYILNTIDKNINDLKI